MSLRDTLRLVAILAVGGALVGCATTQGGAPSKADPLEPFNRAMYAIHEPIDTNIVKPIAGLVSLPAAAGCAIMPASACAALASTFSLMRLMPCTSVIEYIMQMSLGPT